MCTRRGHRARNPTALVRSRRREPWDFGLDPSERRLSTEENAPLRQSTPPGSRGVDLPSASLAPSATPPEGRLSPKDRRAVLKQLSRERLGLLSDRFAVEVADRRSIDAHVEALVRKRSLDFRALLEQLTRDELEAIRLALLGTSGGDKAAIIDRLLGVGSEGVGESSRRAA